MSVDNKLDKTNPDSKLSLELNFNELEDFEPHRVAEQVPEMKKLMDLRTKLTDLKGSLQGNPNFEELLDNTIRNTEKRGQLASEIEKSKGEKK
jgi:type VI secretion system protein ImpB